MIITESSPGHIKIHGRSKRDFFLLGMISGRLENSGYACSDEDWEIITTPEKLLAAMLNVSVSELLK